MNFYQLRQSCHFNVHVPVFKYGSRQSMDSPHQINPSLSTASHKVPVISEPFKANRTFLARKFSPSYRDYWTSLSGTAACKRQLANGSLQSSWLVQKSPWRNQRSASSGRSMGNMNGRTSNSRFSQMLVRWVVALYQAVGEGYPSCRESEQ